MATKTIVVVETVADDSECSTGKKGGLIVVTKPEYIHKFRNQWLKKFDSDRAYGNNNMQTMPTVEM